MYKALDVGCRGTSYKKHYLEEYLPEMAEDIEIVGLDVNPDNHPDILHNILDKFDPAMHEKFDIVYASHVLEHISWRAMFMAANNIVSVLKTDGYLFVLVPSLEWAAEKIRKGENDIAVLGALYGGQSDPWDNHLCGFTKPALKVMAERLGLKVLALTEKPYLSIVNVVEYLAMQDIMLARKTSDEYILLLLISLFYAWRYSKTEVDPDWAMFNFEGFTGSWYGRDYADCKSPAIHLWYYAITKVVARANCTSARPSTSTPPEPNIASGPN